MAEEAELDRARLAEIIGVAADGVIVVDHEGTIVYWNAGAERIFGYRPGEALGSSLDLIIPERLRGRHWSAFERAVATGTSQYGPAELLSVPAITKDGRTISVEFTATLASGSGGISHVGAVLRDVTERRAAEGQLRQRLAALESAAGSAPAGDPTS